MSYFYKPISISYNYQAVKGQLEFIVFNDRGFIAKRYRTKRKEGCFTFHLPEGKYKVQIFDSIADDPIDAEPELLAIFNVRNDTLLPKEELRK